MDVDPQQQQPLEDDDPIEVANQMRWQDEGATDDPMEGQLGPDEISEPDEVRRNRDAKHDH